MNLTQSDVAKESGKRLAESLIVSLRVGLEAMRVSLEEGRSLDALEAREALSPTLLELAELLGHPSRTKSPGIHPGGSGPGGPAGPGFGQGPSLESPGLTQADPEGLQAFRRAAARDLEGLEALYARLCSGRWRSGADVSRSHEVRKAWMRSAGVLGLSAALLACLWGWQWSLQERAETELDLAKSATASEGARLVSMAAWLAMKTQGKPLSQIASDMSGDCSGIDVRQTLPNHPCREAWAANRVALFKAAIPAPGAPVDAPSEIFFDPWGAPYILLIPKDAPPRIVSAGPGGRLGAAENVGVDIPYWPLGPAGGRERQ